VAKKGEIRNRFRPSRRLGQHFLKSERTIRRILTAAGFTSSDRVLEIGPGRGELTIPLARSVHSVVGVEKDENLASILEERAERSGITNIHLVREDILRWKFRSVLPPGAKFQVIGNLPYNISSPVLQKLIGNRGMLERAILMFQEEVARRLTATPGSKDYGALTLVVRYYARPKSLLRVGKERFYPRPKVDSEVVELDFNAPYQSGFNDEEEFRRLVKQAFMHRRKTIVNSLLSSRTESRESLAAVMRSCGIEPGVRAEDLDMDDYLCLSRALR